MINWLSSLPNFTAYGTPVYFIYLLLALLPLGIGLYFGKRFQWYEALISFIFIFLMFDGASWQQLFSLIAYVIYQTILVMYYHHYRKDNNSTGVFYLFSLLSLIQVGS